MEDQKCKDGICTVSDKDRVAANKLKKEDDVLGGGVSIYLFGKKECPVCVEARAFMDEMEISDLNYFDLDTVEGLSKAAYYNAFEVPVIVIFKDGQEIKRWISEVPDTDVFLENLS